MFESFLTEGCHRVSLLCPTDIRGFEDAEAVIRYTTGSVSWNVLFERIRGGKMRNFKSLSERLMGGAIKSRLCGDITECVEDVIDQAICGISQEEYNQLQSGLIIEMVYVVKINPREKDRYVDAMEEAVAKRTEESFVLAFDVKSVSDDHLYLRIARIAGDGNKRKVSSVAERGYAFAGIDGGYLAKTIDYSRRISKEDGQRRVNDGNKRITFQGRDGNGAVFRDRRRASAS